MWVIFYACYFQCDGLIFVASKLMNILMRFSFRKLQEKISSLTGWFLNFIYRYSSTKNIPISFSDIKEFESKWHLNIMKIPPVSTNMSDIMRVSPVLNSICELLWLRDQEYILKQSFDKFALKE